MEFSPKELVFYLTILDLRMSDHYVVFTDRNKKPRKIALVFTMWPLKCAEIVFKMFVIKAFPIRTANCLSPSRATGIHVFNKACGHNERVSKLYRDLRLQTDDWMALSPFQCSPAFIRSYTCC